MVYDYLLTVEDKVMAFGRRVFQDSLQCSCFVVEIICSTERYSSQYGVHARPSSHTSGSAEVCLAQTGAIYLILRTSPKLCVLKGYLLQASDRCDSDLVLIPFRLVELHTKEGGCIAPEVREREILPEGV